MSTDEYDIFINHNSQDKKFIVPILERLNAEYDIRTWLDQWDLYAARDWETVIEGALKTCLSCAVFLGEHGWGEHHRAETEDRAVVADEDSVVAAIAIERASELSDVRGRTDPALSFRIELAKLLHLEVLLFC